MFEEQTQEVILQRMLGRVPAKFDKREGSIIYDATAPASVELQNAYISLDTVIDEAFCDTNSREYLIRGCYERGITPEPASYATVKGVFTPTTVDVPVGTRFSHDDLNYIVTKKVEDGIYYLQCETIGSVANGVTGQLIPIDFISGLQTAKISEVIILGEDEEETESLRARYFASFKADSFGGNLADYKAKILSIAGVGAVKLYSGSQWNGGGTVKAVILDSEYGVPSYELVDKVQTKLDPEVNQGEGIGTVPVGHFCSIVGAYSTDVNIETVLTLADGYTFALIKSKIESAIDDYFLELNKSWSSLKAGVIVRIAKIESAIIGIDGVVDVRETTLNGKAENLQVDKDSIVARGTINE